MFALPSKFYILKLNILSRFSSFSCSDNFLNSEKVYWLEWNRRQIKWQPFHLLYCFRNNHILQRFFGRGKILSKFLLVEFIYFSLLIHPSLIQQLFYLSYSSSLASLVSYTLLYSGWAFEFNFEHGKWNSIGFLFLCSKFYVNNETNFEIDEFFGCLDLDLDLVF